MTRKAKLFSKFQSLSLTFLPLFQFEVERSLDGSREAQEMCSTRVPSIHNPIHVFAELYLKGKIACDRVAMTVHLLQLGKAVYIDAVLKVADCKLVLTWAEVAISSENGSAAFANKI